MLTPLSMLVNLDGRERRGGNGISDKTDGLADRELYTGLIRLHVLHHACEGPIYGLEMIEELRRHGYRLSPGTLYPLLHGLERKGYLTVADERNGSSIRKVYRATPLGSAALMAGKAKVRELFGELFEHDAEADTEPQPQPLGGASPKLR